MDNNSNIKTYKIHKNNICLSDILCRNKKCNKQHIKRKELNICKFDVFFIPYKDDGCHFEDCTYNHPNRSNFKKNKEEEIDNLINSVVNSLELDDNVSIFKDWNRLIDNINNENEKKYKSMCEHFNKIEFYSYEIKKMENLIYYDRIYIQKMSQTILTIKSHYIEFVELFKKLVLESNDLLYKNKIIILNNKILNIMNYVNNCQNNLLNIIRLNISY